MNSAGMIAFLAAVSLVVSYYYLNVAIPSQLQWAGYVVLANSSSSRFVNGIYGTWIVPNVNFSLANSSFSQWIGIGGWKGDPRLMQVGVEANFIGLRPNYTAFYEILGAQNPFQIPISALTVKPSDKIVANITLLSGSGSNETWQILIKDLRSNQSYGKVFLYNASKLSAEWAVESGALGSTVIPLANFNMAYFGPEYTHTSGDFVLLGGTLLTINQANPIQLNSSSYEILTATASPIQADGSSFFVKYSAHGGLENNKAVAVWSYLFWASAVILVISIALSIILNRRPPSFKA